ncbi:MAG: hypothetical protein Q8N03_04505 [Ignavibacteria bacterium]|nr:hypothetical protein [Ignavibacteria bacterium]
MNRILLILIFGTTLLTAQSSGDKAGFGISWGGFVKTDVLFDSRQNVTIREGHFLLYPENKNLDVDNKDINGESSFNMLSIQTRLTGKITAPDVLGAKTSGVLEGAFFGHTNPDINGFRLRLAFVKLQWENSSFLAGQYWHPLFITDVFANVVSFNTGVPFQPFSRNPQLRYTYKTGGTSIIATAYSQRDFSSTGPNGISSEYLRNGVIPGLNLNTMFEFPNLLFGISGDMKTLRPKLVSEAKYLSNEKITSFAGMVYGKYFKDEFSIKMEGVYGSNLYDLTLLGGYASYEKDVITKIEKYTNVNVFSAWTDIAYGKSTEFGLFAGYTKNLGSEKAILTNFSRGTNIAYVYRISPRVIFNIGKFRLAGEVEYTVAGYGTADSNGKVTNTEEVANLRLLTAFYLFF